MKVEINNKEENNKYIVPCLMRYKGTHDLIVLATKIKKEDTEFEGFVISDTRKQYKVGESSEDFDLLQFELYKGSITLSND